MIKANPRAQLATLTDRDVSIVVQVGDIGSSSFDRVPDAIPLGRGAALAKSAELARYAVPPAQYAAWRASIDRDYLKPFRVAGVTVAGLKRVNPEYVREHIKTTKPGVEVTPADIASDTSRLFVLGDFEKVEYRIVDKPEFPTVEFTAVEKSWGPDFIRFDLGMAVSAGGDFAFLARADHTRTWINDLGGQWHNTVQIGQDIILETGLYQPLEMRQTFFVEPFLRLDRNREDVYVDGQQEAVFDFLEAYGQVDLGVNLGTRAQLRAGLRQEWGNATLETGNPAALPELNTKHESDLVLQATYDTRDVIGLATRGSLLIARYLTSGSWLNGEEPYSMGDILALNVVPFRGDSMNFFGSGGAELSGDLPPYRYFRIGGIRSFPGLEREQIRGTDYWLGGLIYNRKLAGIQKLFGQALYGSLRLTAGDVSGRTDGIDDGVMYGLAASLCGRTPVGPFLISLGTTSNGFTQLQLAIGHPIREGNILDTIW